jgi:hypothetical protein
MDGLSPGSRLAVGSLPHLDAATAVQSQLRFFAEIPAWPQLPKRSPKEQMTRQGLLGIPGMVWTDAQKPLWTLRPADTEEALELLISENEAARFERAAFHEDEAPGFRLFLDTLRRDKLDSVKAVKGQCVGPVTLGLNLADESGQPVLASKPHMEILVEYLLMHARWQAAELARTGKPVVFFIDEPAVNGLFTPETYGLKWADLDRWYDSLFGRLQEEGILTGIHCCGPGPWDWVFRASAEIFHLDAFQYLDQVQRQADAFISFMRKGGVVAWGLVPTQKSRGSFPEPAELLTRWSDSMKILARKGMASGEIAGRSFFSTSCGLGLSPLPMAEEAVRCLDMLVTLWKVEVESAS